MYTLSLSRRCAEASLDAAGGSDEDAVYAPQRPSAEAMIFGPSLHAIASAGAYASPEAPDAHWPVASRRWLIPGVIPATTSALGARPA